MFTRAVDMIRNSNVHGPPLPEPETIKWNEVVGLEDGTYVSWNGTASTKNIGLYYMCLGDDKDDILQLMQKAHMATEPILVIRSGKLIFGHEAHSTKGKKHKLPHFFVF